MSHKEGEIPASIDPLRSTTDETNAHDDAMAFVALRGAVKPDDLALWEVQELCQAFLRHLHKSRSEEDRAAVDPRHDGPG